MHGNVYYWRTYDRQEIDLVEDSAGQITGYEIKWSRRKVKPPAQWREGYPEADYTVITRKNYLDFISA